MVTAQLSLMIEPGISYLLGNCSYSTETQYLALQLRFNFSWVTDQPVRAYLTDNCSQYFTFDLAGVTDSLSYSLTSVYMMRLKPRENKNIKIHKAQKQDDKKIRGESWQTGA